MDAVTGGGDGRPKGDNHVISPDSQHWNVQYSTVHVEFSELYNIVEYSSVQYSNVEFSETQFTTVVQYSKLW